MEYCKEQYPRPQFERKDWLNLNGIWTCHISRKSPCCRNRDFRTDKVNSKGFENRILVPFAPETKASGLGVKELIDTIWYHRTIQIPQDWRDRSVIIHFGAVFYHCELFIDGNAVGFHDGGSSSFSFDITHFVEAGKRHDLVLAATANLQDGSIPSGKQSSYISSYTCFYQRTTGIWQTVWMEAVDPRALSSVRTLWNAGDSSLCFVPRFQCNPTGLALTVSVTSPTGRTYIKNMPAVQGAPFSIAIDEPRLWEPGDPNLYTISYSLAEQGKPVDVVSSYVGLRTISVVGNQVYLNGKKLYQRLVLDQGFYPDGNWSAPNDEALKNDIRLALAAGFNGARLHQKVFEERFFYHADCLGYLVWAESPSWGLDYNDEGLPARNFLNEWREIVERDLNHPSIVAWTPLNETYYFKDSFAHRRLHKEAYEICKSLDPTRPVNDASGYIHYITDLWTVHTYLQDPGELRKQLQVKDGQVFRNFPDSESSYIGQPYLVDEYGGVKWDPSTQGDVSLSTAQNLESWGYGQAPRTETEFLSRMMALTDVLLSLDHVSGYCYTQLTDVEQEKNGLYYYNRKPKFEVSRYHEIFSRKPAGYGL